MNCPSCGSILKEHQSPKGATFLTCSQWPTCGISGTPALMEQLQKVSEAVTSIQGESIAQKEKHEADMERLWDENNRRRKILDELFRCCECNGWFPVSELQPASPDPQADPVCNRCLNHDALRNQVVELQKRGTPVEQMPDDPVPLGAFVVNLAQIRIHQSRLRKSKTQQEREAIRKQALEAIQ